MKKSTWRLLPTTGFFVLGSLFIYYQCKVIFSGGTFSLGDRFYFLICLAIFGLKLTKEEEAEEEPPQFRKGAEK